VCAGLDVHDADAAVAAVDADDQVGTLDVAAEVLERGGDDPAVLPARGGDRDSLVTVQPGEVKVDGFGVGQFGGQVRRRWWSSGQLLQGGSSNKMYITVVRDVGQVTGKENTRPARSARAGYRRAPGSRPPPRVRQGDFRRGPPGVPLAKRLACARSRQ